MSAAFVCRCGRTAAVGPGPCACGRYLVERLALQATPHDTRLGLVVLGRYALVDVLGRGGMGAVYRGLDVRVGGAVAVKILDVDPALVRGLSPDVRVTRELEVHERFAREARALSRLQHPNTVRLVDFGIDDHTPIIVQELVVGEDLRRYAGRRALDVATEIVPVLRGVACALAEVHRLGLVHRDVKPHNVIVRTFDGLGLFPRLVDFGVAFLPEATRITGGIIGSPAFMAPEQAMGWPVDGRADVYGLGALAFWLLARRPPIDGPQDAVIIRKLDEDAPPLHTVVPHVDRRLSALVDHALARQPGDRCPSAVDFLAGLDAVGGAERPSAASLTFDGPPLHRFEISPPRAVVGRADPVSGHEPEVDLGRLGAAADGISRRHAELIRTPAGWAVVDLGSTNGTAVDGVRVRTDPVSLPPGAVLRFGRAALRWSAR